MGDVYRPEEALASGKLSLLSPPRFDQRKI